MYDSMRVVSLNVALPSTQRYGGREVLTGGAKTPVLRAALRFDNFDGDGQADRVNHGGPDKAVCIYAFDHYAYWERMLGRELSPGAFSENLTVSRALETELCVGDVFRIGEALVQISQPRMPCNKLAGKNGEPLLVRWIAQTGYTGFYARVLAEGVVAAGCPFESVWQYPERISIAEVNDLIYERSNDLGLIERLSRLPEFAADGRALLAQRAEIARAHDRNG
jgi:MOSC domain-containing protein YiiM